MKRNLLAVLLVLLTAWVPFTLAQAPDEAVREAVVLNPDKLSFYRIGTAFHVGGGAFYTNAHVVRAKIPDGYTQWYLASTSSSSSRDTWLGPAIVACVHPRWQDPGDPNRSAPFDVATFKVNPKSDLPPALTLTTRTPLKGDQVTIKGFASASLGWPPKLYLATGRVSNLWQSEQAFSIDIESGFALEGSSGSPVLDSEGRVVGIVYARSGQRDRSAATQQFAVTVAGMSGCSVAASPLVTSAPAVAADSWLVLEAVQKLQENYVEQVDPVKLLNAGIQGLRKQLADVNITADLPDLPAGIDTQVAQQIFTERYASARSAAPDVNETQLAHRAIRSAIELLDDPSTRFLTPEEYVLQQAQRRSGYGGVGLVLAMRAGKHYVWLVIPGGPAEAAGARPFDRIDKVDDLSTEGMTAAQLVNFVRGTVGTPVKLTLRRPGSVDPIVLTMSRASIRIPAIIRARLLRDRVAYLHLYGFEDGAANEFRAVLSRLGGETLQGLILDLRGGGGGFYRELDGMLDALLAPGTTTYITESRRGRAPVVTLGPPMLPTQARLIVLVDNPSTLGEVLAAAVKVAGRGLLVGTKTPGQVMQIQRFELKGGSALEITSVRVLTARGTRLDKNGVDPDVVISMETEEFEAGRDRQLDEALQRLK
jgi:carboxyl-terminal processing protease